MLYDRNNGYCTCREILDRGLGIMIIINVSSHLYKIKLHVHVHFDHLYIKTIPSCTCIHELIDLLPVSLETFCCSLTGCSWTGEWTVQRRGYQPVAGPCGPSPGLLHCSLVPLLAPPPLLRFGSRYDAFLQTYCS